MTVDEVNEMVKHLRDYKNVMPTMRNMMYSNCCCWCCCCSLVSEQAAKVKQHHVCVCHPMFFVAWSFWDRDALHKERVAYVESHPDEFTSEGESTHHLAAADALVMTPCCCCWLMPMCGCFCRAAEARLYVRDWVANYEISDYIKAHPNPAINLQVTPCCRVLQAVMFVLLCLGH